MIHLEAWHIEADSLEQERNRLIRQLKDRQIGLEEFYNLMKRMETSKGLLEVSDDGNLFMTPEWIYRHRDIIDKMKKLQGEWRDITNIRWLEPDGSLGWQHWMQTPKFLSETVMEGRLSMQDVQEAILVMRTIPDPGSDVNVYYGIFRGGEFESEQGFTEWYYRSAENARTVVGALEQYLLDQGYTRP